MTSVREQRKKEHKRIALALAISLLIHLLIILAAFIILTLHPDLARKVLPQAQPEEPVEVTFLPPPTPTPPPKEKDFIDSAEGQASEKAPEQAAFESDQNMVAASERPAQSNEPLPSLEGDDLPGLTLQAQNLSLGPAKQPAPPSPAAQAQQQQQKPEQKSPQKPEKPQPEKEKPNESKATPTPRPTPRPEDSELALLDPARPRPQQPQEKPKPEIQKPQPPQQPSRPQTPGFQPERRVTRLTGGITNRGRASVDAIGTPLGRYKKALSDAIGSRWYYYVNDAMDMVSMGTVQMRFTVDAAGKVQNVRVLNNTANEALASVSVRSIIEAEIPPIPKDIAPTLAGGQLEVDYSFSIVGR
jgi:outer membrane biosynthesis protein TonB